MIYDMYQVWYNHIDITKNNHDTYVYNHKHMHGVWYDKKSRIQVYGKLGSTRLGSGKRIMVKTLKSYLGSPQSQKVTFGNSC